MLVDKKYMYRDKKGRPKLYSPGIVKDFRPRFMKSVMMEK